MAGLTAVNWGLAVQVMAVASIGSDLTFVPTTEQTLYVLHTLTSKVQRIQDITAGFLLPSYS